MNEQENLVFITNDIVLFPNSEVRFDIVGEFDSDFFRKLNKTERRRIDGCL